MINIDFEYWPLIAINVQHRRLWQFRMTPIERCDNLGLRVCDLHDTENGQQRWNHEHDTPFHIWTLQIFHKKRVPVVPG
jgi:hypothetical protein